MKLPYIEVKFYPEVKSQTGLSSLRVSCKRAHSHEKRKDSLETRVEYIKTAKNGGFSEQLLSEKDFEAALATFCCYDSGANAYEAVQKIASDKKHYHKCSSCVIVC